MATTLDVRSGEFTTDDPDGGSLQMTPCGDSSVLIQVSDEFGDGLIVLTRAQATNLAYALRRL